MSKNNSKSHDQILKYIALNMDESDIPDISMFDLGYLLRKMMDGRSWKSHNDMDRVLESELRDKIRMHGQRYVDYNRQLSEDLSDWENPYQSFKDINNEKLRNAMFHMTMLGQYNRIYEEYGELISSVVN